MTHNCKRLLLKYYGDGFANFTVNLTPTIIYCTVETYHMCLDLSLSGAVRE